MRVVIDTGGELELEPGRTLGEAREAIAAAGGPPAGTPLRVGGRVLDDAHVVGTPPLVAGAALSASESARVDTAALAARAPWHVAVLTGDDAGTVLVPRADGTVLVPRADGTVLVPRANGTAVPNGRRGVRGGVVVRRAAPWTVLVPAALRRAPGRRMLRPGERTKVGHGAGAALVELRQPARPGARSPASAGSTQPTEPLAGTPRTAAPAPMVWLAPALVSVGLAALLRSPVLLAFAAVGPLTALGPWLAGRRRRGRTTLVPDPAAIALTVGDTAEQGGWVAHARDGGLVLRGPDAHAVARSLMLSHTGPLTLLHPRDEDERWAWARWLVPRLAVARSDGSTRAALARDVTGPHLVVVVRPARVENALEGWGTQRRGPADALVVVAEEPRNGSAPPDAPGPRADDGTADRDVPSWCRWTLGTGPRARLTGPGTDRRLEVWTAGTTWAERTARRLAPAAAPADTGGALPARAALADLLPTEPADLARRWSALGAPTCPIGVGTSGVVELDLRRDGPHALVAGTTGAGKSELLQSLVLGLAHARPPGELAFVLVDYKGGAGFGHCRDLPHVVGTVTDLDENGAARAVHAVRAELRRREQLLAAAGVADLESLRAVDPHAPPALVMVVDELRALVDDMPDAVPALIRIATQGRSLGVHLVLATQRPAGAVNAELRANLALRICLRVADEADSLDVVDAPDAAAIAPACAGRALVRRGPGSPEAVQTAWAAGQPRAARPPARRAPAWREVEWPAHDEATQHGLAAASDDGVDHALTLVRTVRAAARLAGSAAPAAPWLAPLPARISPDDVPRLLAAGAPAHDGPALGTADTGPARDEGLLLGITDLPAERRRGVVRWRPASGPLLVAGPPGSGRSTALRTVAAAALASGHHVHVLHAAARPLALPATVGTVVGADDPRRVQRLADLLSRGHAPAPHVLLVDDVGAVVRALDETTREGGTTLLDQLVRARVPIAVAGLPGDAARLLPHARDLLALGRPDVADTALLGLPAHAPGTRPDASVAGRGRHRGTSGVQVCQVVLADPAAATLPAGTPEPPRLRALPAHVRPDDLPADPPGTLVTVGLGGDEAGAVRLEVAAGALVVGPPGTGRTTALRTLTARLARQGWEVITPPPHRLSTEALGELTVARAAPRALVVDDLDLRLRADPLMEAALETLAEPRGPHVPGTPAPPVLVASSRTEAAATAFRGPLATLRNHAALVLLAPLEPGSREVAGTDLRAEADPAHPRLPGRGVVVERGRVTGVQVADAQAGPP